jgi:hypothetical protein
MRTGTPGSSAFYPRNEAEIDDLADPRTSPWRSRATLTPVSLSWPPSTGRPQLLALAGLGGEQHLNWAQTPPGSTQNGCPSGSSITSTEPHWIKRYVARETFRHLPRT